MGSEMCIRDSVSEAPDDPRLVGERLTKPVIPSSDRFAVVRPVPSERCGAGLTVASQSFHDQMAITLGQFPDTGSEPATVLRFRNLPTVLLQPDPRKGFAQQWIHPATLEAPAFRKIGLKRWGWSSSRGEA